jgi:formylglycine-generating enzyme required for sulfatase activity
MDFQIPQTITAKDGKEIVLIPGGDFLFGADKQPRTLPDYYIDRTQVTNAEYKRYVDANGIDFPPHWRMGAPVAGTENHPVVHVTWFDAAGYAKWAGKRLPTGPEWEKAARGTDGRLYPWGDTYDKTRLNSGDGGPLKVLPVAQFSPQGDSPFGIVDMSGNVYEWTNDGNEVVTMGLRGGSWLDGRDEARTFAIRRHTPRRKNDFIGFRCVMDVPK